MSASMFDLGDQVRRSVDEGDPVVLIVMTSDQRRQLIGDAEPYLIPDPSVTRNALMTVPVEVNNAWVGEPGLLTAKDVEKYRGARRRLDLRMDPARRLKL